MRPPTLPWAWLFLAVPALGLVSRVRPASRAARRGSLEWAPAVSLPLAAPPARPVLLQSGRTEEGRGRGRGRDFVMGSSPSKDPLFWINSTFKLDVTKNWNGVTLITDPDTGIMRGVAGLHPKFAVAWARYSDKLDKTGWTELIVETTESSLISNSMRMYGAGYCEGLLTATRISQFYYNFWQILNKDTTTAAALVNVQNMLYKELDYMKLKSNLNQGPGSAEPTDPYWKHVRYVLLQMWGIRDGYNAMAKQAGQSMLDLVDMLIINNHADLPELMEAYLPKHMKSRRHFQALALRRRGASAENDGGGSDAGSDAGVNPAAAAAAAAAAEEEDDSADAEVAAAASAEPVLVQRSSAEVRTRSRMAGAAPEAPSAAVLEWADRDWERRLTKHGHCSAFVRVAPDSGDLFVGHTTWNDYSKMTRVYKYYKFKLPGSDLAATTIAMSSYPGCVSSTDDFYQMSSGLAAMDTSIELLNPNMYDRIAEFPKNPHIPPFVHVMVVNRMAHTSMDWTNLLGSRNPGVPMAQWLVVDYNLFKPGMPVKDNTLRLIEQIPGLTHQGDMSQMLRSQGYWASYNRPYFPDIRRSAGHDRAEKSYGALYSFADGPRATIFKHLGGLVNNLFDMRNLMNRNAFPNEHVAPSEAGHAVSARMDLDATGHIPNGGIDAKVFGRCMFRLLQCHAVSGPSHDKQPVFKWRGDNGAELFTGWPHVGLPDVWNFGWVQMTPTELLTTPTDVCNDG